MYMTKYILTKYSAFLIIIKTGIIIKIKVKIQKLLTQFFDHIIFRKKIFNSLRPKKVPGDEKCPKLIVKKVLFDVLANFKHQFQFIILGELVNILLILALTEHL